MSFETPSDVMHILMTTNTSAIAAVLTSTITAWVFLGKPDLGMTVNGCLAGLVAVTGGCAYFTVEVSLLVGALSGVLVVFLVVFFDRIHIDDPVGATSVHLGCGVFGTVCVGLFAKEGVTTLSSADGLFYGGGTSLLTVQLLGVAAIGAFVFLSSGLVWLVLKHTVGIRVSREEELAGLDIGEHGNVAYPDFAAPASIGEFASEETAAAQPAPGGLRGGGAGGPPDGARRNGRPQADEGVYRHQPARFAQLQEALEKLGVTGMTVTNVFGYGVQKGHRTYYRGAPVEARLLPKMKIDVVISRIPAETLVEAARQALYTGQVGDGKIFVYDVENVVKVRTGETGTTPSRTRSRAGSAENGLI